MNQDDASQHLPPTGLPEEDIPVPFELQRVALLEASSPGLTAAFSTALPRSDDASLAERLRKAMVERLDRPVPTPVLLAQRHSAEILEVDTLNAHPEDGGGLPSRFPAGDHGDSPLHADGTLSSRTGGALLAVKTADCVPILAVDRELDAYAALHAGWRGVAAGILPRLLRRWAEAGSSLAAVRLAFGPHIRGCCYEVGADCLAHFPGRVLQGAVLNLGGATHLDLAAVLREQARPFGIGNERIAESSHCTGCHTAPDGSHPYASYRRTLRNGGDLTSINVGLIGMLDGTR